MSLGTAVILAAGMGTRLRDSHSDMPKGFLKLGHKPIISESIDRLRAAGIDKIIIVTGYLADFYEELSSTDENITTVHNSAYAKSGSMYSLWCARDQIHGGFLLLESDLIYEQRALEVLINGPDEAILLSGKTNSGDEVYVQTKDDVLNGNLYNMSKDLDVFSSDPSGELVGITRISPALFRFMLEYAEREFNQDNLRVDYETDALVYAGRKMSIMCPVIDDLVWAEIDDSEHLERAQFTVYPKLAGLA